MWDMHVQHTEMREDGALAISYARRDENDTNLCSLEVLKHTYHEAYTSEGATFLIKETVNEGQETRYYELVSLPLRPYTWKVRMYAQMSPRILRTRGRDLYRSLGSLRTYIESVNASSKI